MKSVVQLKTATPPILTCLHRYAKHCWQVTLALACFGLLPGAQAVVPAPDGGYPGGNTAEGTSALLSLTTGSFNTAVGFFSLLSATEGNFNTGVGAGTLLANKADQNTATGAGALLSSTTGFQNTANGTFALFSNTEGSLNTATGDSALFSNTTGNFNTANGFQALFRNTIGNNNAANGHQALLNNTTGNNNTADGANALASNTTGFNNTADGLSALFGNISGSGNIAVGIFAGANLTTGDNNIDIGNVGLPAESSTIRIGEQGTQAATFIAGISGATVAKGIPVIIDANGQLGTIASSARFKDEIKPMDKASDAILALKPVTFRYKKELDPDRIPQFGLVAEEVEKVTPDLVARNAKGQVYTVRYEAVNAMLLNEFLKEHKRVEEQQASTTQLKSTVARQEALIAQQQMNIKALTASLKEQAEQIQKVRVQLEVGKSAPRTVLNNQ
jgi:hypothetical protein